MKRDVEPLQSESLGIRDIISEEGPITVSVQMPEYPSPLPFFPRRKQWDKWEVSVNEAREELDNKSIEALREDLVNKGLSGTHKLLAKPVGDRGVWGETRGEWKLDGHLFLVFGSIEGRGEIEGHTRTVSSVRFAWSPCEGEILISEIPADKLVIELCPEREAPTVSFKINAGAFIKSVDKSNYRTWSNRVLRLPHPNDYLRGDRLAEAHLTINTSDARGSNLLSLPVSEDTTY